jgi:hypothetical protein
MEHRSRPYEVDGAGGAADAPLRWTRLARVDVDYFRALETSILSGRNFERTDVEGGSRVAIVNTAFVERALNGADPIGRRVRFAASSSPDNAVWY